MEILYDIFIKEFMNLGQNNPIYQQPMLFFFYRGLSWDIEKFRNRDIYTPFCDIRTDITITLDTVINRSYNQMKPACLRKVDYLKCITVLIGYHPELFPD